MDDAEQQIADQGAPRGRLRISAALSHGRLCIVPLLGDFARLYPHILLDFALTDAIVDVAGVRPTWRSGSARSPTIY